MKVVVTRFEVLTCKRKLKSRRWNKIMSKAASCVKEWFMPGHPEPVW